MSNSVKIKPSLADKMVKSLIKGKIYGDRASIGESDIHQDGRKRKPLLRQLIEAGYIQESSGVAYNSYTITDAIFAENDSEKPNLTAIIKNSPEMKRLMEGYSVYDYQESVRLSDLTQAEQIYVVTHPEEFTFSAYDFGKRTHFEFGKGNESLDAFRSNTICVSTPEYIEFVESIGFEIQIKGTMRANLAHGLRKLCGATQGDTDYLEVNRKRDLGDSATYINVDAPPSFTEESVVWGGVLGKNVDACHKAIAFATCKLDALNRIEKQVALYGGWDKFRADLQEMVIRKLTEEAKEEEQTAQS